MFPNLRPYTGHRKPGRGSQNEALKNIGPPAQVRVVASFCGPERAVFFSESVGGDRDCDFTNPFKSEGGGYFATLNVTGVQPECCGGLRHSYEKLPGSRPSCLAAARRPSPPGAQALALRRPAPEPYVLELEYGQEPRNNVEDNFNRLGKHAT